MQAFVDERVAPDILVYKADIMTAVEDLVGQQVRLMWSRPRNVSRSVQR